MSKTNAKSLIKSLADDLQPVKPLAHPLMRIVPWFALAFAYVAGVSYYLGFRHDLMEVLQTSPAFLFENTLALVIVLVSGAAASWLCVPDSRGNLWLPSASLAFIGAFCLFTLVRGLTEGVYIHTFNFEHCFMDGLLMGLIPAAFMVWITRKGRTTRPLLLAAMSLSTITAAGYIGLRFTCALDVVGHAALYHLFPFVIAGGILGAIARHVYKW